MEVNKFITLFNRKKQTVLVFLLIGFLLAVMLTVIQPFKYETKSKILVYQDNTDPYAMSKSGQYLSSLFVSIIESGSFFEDTVNAGYNIDLSYFTSDPGQQLKVWEETVEPRIVDDSGIFSVNVFHTDRYQSKQIAQAINYVIKTNHSAYHGAGDKVMVKIIDSPASSNFPVRPRIFLNLIAGLVSALILSLVYIYLFPEERFNIRLLPRKRNLESKTGIVNQKEILDKLKVTNDREISKIENNSNTQNIRKDIRKVVNIPLEPINDLKTDKNNQSVLTKTKIFKKNRDFVKRKSQVLVNDKTVNFDKEEIESKGSISNVIGFSNLSN